MCTEVDVTKTDIEIISNSNRPNGSATTINKHACVLKQISLSNIATFQFPNIRGRLAQHQYNSDNVHETIDYKTIPLVPVH